MRPSGAAQQFPPAGILLPTTLDDFSDSVLGDPITYAQCELIPGSDAPMSLPVCIRCLLDSLIGRISLRFRLCWLRGPPLIQRWGPPPSLLQWIWRTARCWRRACRVVRISSCRIVGWLSRMGIQSSSVHRNRLACCTIRQRFGWISLERNRRWQLPSVFSCHLFSAPYIVVCIFLQPIRQSENAVRHLDQSA